MRRRQKFFLASLVLTLSFLAIQLVPLQWRPLALSIFALLSYLLAAWSLFENLEGIEWVTVVPLPALYGLSVTSFYFLLPSSWVARIVGVRSAHRQPT